MKNAFFFQTQQIPDTSSIFDQLKQQNIFFSYFQVDQNYYLFLYAQESIDINFLYQSVNVIQELDSKQRKIRSLRGFFLYALEILENGKDYEILETNLQPFFWRKVKNIIRQNKKPALQEFLFGSQDSIAAPETQNHLNEKIESLETQLSSLQQKVIDLEAKLENPKSPRSGLLEGLESTKSIQQSDSTLEVKKGPYLPKNNSEVRDSTSRGKDMESKSFSEAPRRPFQPLSGSQQIYPQIKRKTKIA